MVFFKFGLTNIRFVPNEFRDINLSSNSKFISVRIIYDLKASPTPETRLTVKNNTNHFLLTGNVNISLIPVPLYLNIKKPKLINSFKNKLHSYKIGQVKLIGL